VEIFGQIRQISKRESPLMLFASCLVSLAFTPLVSRSATRSTGTLGDHKDRMRRATQ
jgi:hypothetical protein